MITPLSTHFPSRDLGFDDDYVYVGFKYERLSESDYYFKVSFKQLKEILAKKWERRRMIDGGSIEVRCRAKEADFGCTPVPYYKIREILKEVREARKALGPKNKTCKCKS